MADVSLVYSVRNNYEIFRLALESALEYIPKEDYKEIIIANDHSNDPETLGFFNALKNDESINVRVIDAGEPLETGYYSEKGRGSKIKEDIVTSLGHGETVNLGIDNVTTRYVLICDSDILFLPKGKDIIKNMLECFKLDEKILCVGQCSGKIDGIKIFEGDRDWESPQWKGKPLKYGLPPGFGRPFNYFKNKYDTEATGGFPGGCFMMCDMESWTKHGLSKLNNSGWAHAPYHYSLYRHEDNFKICNYNTMKDRYVIHLGYSTVRVTRKNFEATLGFVKDSMHYGSIRSGTGIEGLNDWYGGYHSLNVNMSEFLGIIEREYKGFPPNERKSIVHTMI